MKEISLSEFIQDDKYSHLKNKDLNIVQVEILKDEMDMNLKCVSQEVLENNEVSDIERMFCEKFQDFNINLKIEYDCKLDGENMKCYIRNIKEIILASTPSSKSWIDDLEFELINSSLKIYTANKFATMSISRNGLEDKLKKKIQEELGLDIEIIEREKSICKNEFLDEKEEEAKRLSQKAMEEARLHASQLQAGSNDSGGPIIRDDYSIGPAIKLETTPIEDVTIESGRTAIRGEVFDLESREIKDKRLLITLYISDNTDSMPAKIFLSNKDGLEFLENIKKGDYISVQGDVNYDNFSRMKSMMFRSLKKLKKTVKMDQAKEKRVELHMHTKMSAMDATSDVRDIVERAKLWGHEAVAITDHGVVQAFPEAMYASADTGVKVIYGLEGYLVDDDRGIISNYKPEKDYSSFVVFDIETTGLSAMNDGITEIGAIKLVDGEVVDEYSQLINPEKLIPEFITELTGIDDHMVRDKPTIKEVLPSFVDFIGDSVLVAHNASFDTGFIREKMKDLNLELNNPVLDTLELSRGAFPDLKNHKLDNLAKFLEVNLVNHHRAVDDAKATTEIFQKTLELLAERDIETFEEINALQSKETAIRSRPYHVVILAKNLVGLKNLYKLISKSHIDYFYRSPRIPKTLLEEYREGLLIGSACEAGELYQAILNRSSSDEIRSIVDFYDYLEIQPLDNNKFLLEKEILSSREQLKDINKDIYALGKQYDKPVVATGDVHFLDPEDEVYRRILMAGQGFKDADDQPPLYYRTTNEMLDEFDYLGEDIAYEVVVENTNLINSWVEEILPIPKGTYPPVIDGSDDELREITYEKSYEIYGNPLPEIVKKRLERELTAIIENNYSVMYVIGQKLVWKSMEDGYLVGSRGSVGSSFVATMSGITEVNPLAPHYVCPNCQYSEFFTDGKISSGADLEDKDCPQCGSSLTKEGHDIPFEVFLGFEGDKEPDIDLNFASEYQSSAHSYTEELFGEGYVYRAGTIGTIADKTAYGFVKKYFEQKEENVNPAETNRLLKGCTGVRRSSGQHPGGVMIVPRDMEIYDFSPIQHPANDKESGVITTHFDYDAISSQILKLDILGHDVPSIIRSLEDMTGVDPIDIPLDEPETMKIFNSTESLGIEAEDIDSRVGSLGIPEFGTRFVRQMLVDTRPNKFSELVRISGLSHGTDVWLNNAQELVRSGSAKLSEVISTREDIMLTLINAGLEKQTAFWIMEKVRKGRPLSEEEINSMRGLDLPPWYIDSCEKIKYMFPKAHAVAYVMMSFRIAYFKVYHPEAFYATYFTTKVADFDANLVLKGPEAVAQEIRRIESLGNESTSKEKNQLTVLEVVREMYARGYEFAAVDLYKSDSDEFSLVDGKVQPPLKGLDGVGENAAKNIAREREIASFISREDLSKRAGVNKTAIDALARHGCLDGIPESDQISFF